MWRAVTALVLLVALSAACSSGGDDEPPLPTFSASTWASKVCNSPASIQIILLDPQVDPRFDSSGSLNGDPKELVAGRVDLNIRNLRNLAEYFEVVEEPEVVAEFHQALIDGTRRLADDVADARDEILAAQSLAELEQIHADLMAKDDERLAELRLAASTTLQQDVVEEIDERSGCWEHLGIDPIEMRGTSS